MDTTIDNKLISRMLSVDDYHQLRSQSQHHFQSGMKTSHGEGQSAPVFLHFRRWPSPSLDPEFNENAVKSSSPCVHNDKSGALEQGRGLKWPEGRLQRLEYDDEIQSPRCAKASTVTAEDVERSVDAWKIDSDVAELWSDRNHVTVPYAVMTLLGDRVVGNHQAGGVTRAVPPRKALFKQEILAECQAREEIKDYIGELNDLGQYQEAFECIWPLEEDRRLGWASELLMAFPSECKWFVDNNPAQGETTAPKDR